MTVMGSYGGTAVSVYLVALPPLKRPESEVALP
jgi:hypothetical protein